MIGRYELSNQHWALTQDIVSPQEMGRPRRDDRQMLNGIFLDACARGSNGVTCPSAMIPLRFRQWRDDVTCERILARLYLKLRQDGYLDTWIIDSTMIRATRAASGAEKGARKNR